MGIGPTIPAHAIFPGFSLPSPSTTPSPGLLTPFLNDPWPLQTAPSPPSPPGDSGLSDFPGALLETSPSSSEFSKFKQLYRKGHVCHLGKQGQTGMLTLTLQFTFYWLITALEMDISLLPVLT